jgi:carbon-monoxide dehydrogenase large subunit
METRGLLAQWDKDKQRITVSGASKVPFFVRATLAAMMQLPLENVDMIEVDVGGGFGVRGEFYPEDYLVPFAARQLNRPIKWVEDRLENLLGTNHSREIECEIEVICAGVARCNGYGCRRLCTQQLDHSTAQRGSVHKRPL